MRKLIVVGLVAVVTGLCIPVSDASAQGSIAMDQAALEASYRATNGPNWTHNTNWLSAEPLSSWYGVETNENGRVTSLDLGANQLSGSIPPELGRLASLESLELGHNQLSGSIPPELGRLASLDRLRLDSTQLSGPIPPELGRLANLHWLWLNGNELSGLIAETNQVYRESGVNQRLLLVASEEVQYTETTDPFLDLARFATPSDNQARAPAQRDRDTVTDDFTLRRRPVTFAVEKLARAAVGNSPRALTLNLFDDVVFTGIIERRSPTLSGGYALSGRIEGVELGTMTLVVNDSAVAGVVRTPIATYRIGPAGESHAVSQIDPSRLPKGAKPLRTEWPEYDRPGSRGER